MLILGRSLVVALLALGWAYAQSFVWHDVQQDVTILPDGTVVVSDERTLTTDADFGEAFLCIHLRPGQRVYLLGGSGALDPGPPATAFQQGCSGGTELVVRNDSRVEERRVRFEYRLEGSVDFHRDVVQWYWNILERDHPPVRGYRLTVHAPGPMRAPYDAFVHRYNNTELPEVSLSDDRSLLEVGFDFIPDGDGVEIRYLMEPALFTVTGRGSALQGYLDEEAEIAGIAPRPGPLETLGRQLRFAFTRYGYVTYPLLALLAWMAWGIARDYRRYGVEPEVAPQMRYPFEPPSGLAPGAVTVLGSQGALVSSSQSARALQATVMDLARRGFGEFRTENGKFTMHLDLARDPGELEPFEREALDYLQSAAASQGTPEYLFFKELKGYSSSHLSSFLKTWYEKVAEAAEEHFGGSLVDPDSKAAARRWSARSIGAAVLCGLMSWIGGGFTVGILFVGIWLFGALAALSYLSLPSWRPHVLQELRRWRGFKRTLRDYSRMQSAPDDFFVLWDRYYCYAAALGVAKSYLKNIGRAMEARQMDTSRLSSSAWLGHSGGSFAELSHAVSSVSSALSRAGVSASSGGSSSGGGGGGGGGGSSGGR